MSNVNDISEDVNSGDKVITFQEVLTIVKRITEDSSVKVLEYHLEAFSKEKLGFLGSHQLLKIKFQRQAAADTEILNLFVKSIPHLSEKQTNFAEQIYYKEIDFYETIATEFYKNYKGEKWSSVCYLVKKNAMVMENLNLQGYKVRKSLYDEIAPLKSAIAAIARFHACSILTEDRLSQSMGRPINLGEFYEKSLTEVSFVKTGDAVQWMSNSINLTAFIAENLGYDSSKLRKVYELMYDVVKPSPTHRNVICHGDLWRNNIMFNDAEPLPKCKLVDFQIIRYAPTVLDILQFLYVNSSQEFRRKYENELIEFYHSTLEKTIMDSDSFKRVKIPTLKEILYALSDLRYYGVALACLYLPITMLDPTVLDNCTKDSDGYNNFIFGDRINFTLTYMKKDAMFKKQLEECVTELVKISDQLY